MIEFDAILVQRREDFMSFYIKLEGYLGIKQRQLSTNLQAIESEVKEIRIQVNLNYKALINEIRIQGYDVGEQLLSYLQPEGFLIAKNNQTIEEEK